MIVPMSRVRVLGPRDRLDATLSLLQDEGRVQLARPMQDGRVSKLAADPRAGRRRHQLQGVLNDVDEALSLIGHPAARAASGSAARTTASLACGARVARRTVREARTLVARLRDLTEERQLITRYRDFFTEILPAIHALSTSPRLTAQVAVVPAASRSLVDQLREALRREFGAEFSMMVHGLDNGDLALLLVLPKPFSERLEARLRESRVPQVPLPAAYAELPLEQAVPRMIARLQAIPGDMEACRLRLSVLASDRGEDLRATERAARDWLSAADAHDLCGVTAHTFALEGWLPAHYLPPLQQRVAREVGPEVVVEEVARESWSAADAPVVLSNPRLFRPFEQLTSFMPLPSYGTIDPTPFVAVFFPMFFGVMLGDVGYGLVLGAVSGLVWRRSRPGSVARNIAAIGMPCAFFAIIFGVLYGEYFGDLGRTLFGFRAIWIDREDAIVASLTAALGLGVMHVTLGLVLGAISAFHSARRRAVGRAVSAVMVLVVVAALLAAFHVLPRQLFTPSVIALLICFPIVVAAEGLLGTIELFQAMGNVLSYARIMAIGTASVVLAVVANRMVGAVGSTVIGLLFALLFHLVNFGIGIFSPVVHALRLHYVEFFGQFYSPGGRRYEPFARWRADQGIPPHHGSVA